MIALQSTFTYVPEPPVHQLFAITERHEVLPKTLWFQQWERNGLNDRFRSILDLNQTDLVILSALSCVQWISQLLKCVHHSKCTWIFICLFRCGFSKKFPSSCCSIWLPRYSKSRDSKFLSLSTVGGTLASSKLSSKKIKISYQWFFSWIFSPQFWSGRYRPWCPGRNTRFGTFSGRNHFEFSSGYDSSCIVLS